MTDSNYPVPVPQPEPREDLGSSVSVRAEVSDLPPEKQILAGKILGAVGSDADEGTELVVTALARRLPEASLAKVFESLVANRGVIMNRAAYAVGALQSEFLELAERR